MKYNRFPQMTSFLINFLIVGFCKEDAQGFYYEESQGTYKEKLAFVHPAIIDRSARTSSTATTL